MLDIVELARVRGLPTCAELLRASGIGATAALDESLASVAASDAPTALDQIRRRGLDPQLFPVLLEWFADRPLELGLFSWDVLCSSLLTTADAPLVETLRRNAAVVREILPAPGSTFANFRSLGSGAAAARWAAPTFRNASDDQLTTAAVTLRSIGALEQLRQRHGIEVLDSGGMLESTRKFALMLHLGHLSTLASFYLDYCFHVLGNRAALGDYIDVLLDVGAIDALPGRTEVVPTQSLREFELFGYMQSRAGIIAHKQKEIFEALRTGTRIDYRLADGEKLLESPRAHLVYADAGLELREFPVPYPLIDEIANRHPAWKYAHRVRAALAAATAESASSSPLHFVEKFLETFGNDFRLWYSVRRYAPPGSGWLAPLEARLVGEVIALPHDWMAWAALASLIKTKQRNALAEVNRRAEWQCEVAN